TQLERAAGRFGFDRADIVLIGLAGPESHRQPLWNDWAAGTHVEVALLIWSFGRRERIPCIQGVALESEFICSMKRARPAALEDLGVEAAASGKPVAAGSGGHAKRLVLGGERIIVDADLLDLLFRPRRSSLRRFSFLCRLARQVCVPC